jgi:endogenous inhibitor of DNA gyrase (YacG/DUF329 family)
MDKCPGTNPKSIRPDEVFEADCPHCGKPIEFFGNDTVRRCPSCGKSAPNPHAAAAPEATAKG